MILLADQIAHRRRQLAGWSTGVLALTAMTVGAYPAVRDQPGFEEMVTELPDTLKAVFGLDTAVSILSPAGYLQGRVFSLLLPALLTVLAVGIASKILAGAEEDGTLEPVVVSAVSRRRIAGELAATAAVILAGTTATSLALLVALGPVVDLDVGIGRLVAMHVAAFLLALAHGAIAFCAAAATGRVAHGTLAGGAIAATGYVVSGLGDVIGALSSVRVALPWHWYAANASVATGVEPAAILPPVVLSAIAVTVAVRAFGARDLRSL